MSAIDLVEVHEFRYSASNVRAQPPDFDLIASPGHYQALEKFAIVIGTAAGDRGEYVGLWGATKMSLGQVLDLAPRLIGRDALQREAIYDDFKRAHRQYDHMGFGYIDICLWDLVGKRWNASVSQLLGGWRKRLPAYASTTHGDETILASAAAYADFADKCYELGYRGFKMHGWGDGNVKREIATVDALGDRVGDKMALMNDPACQLRTFMDALEVGKACDRNQFKWFEDPFRDTGVSFQAHRRLRERLTTPLLVGEHVRGVEPKADLAISGGTDLLRADPEYDLGITGAMKIAHLGEALGMDVEIHAAGPAHRHCMSSMRNTNYYEVALVNPVAPNPLPHVYASDYSDDLESVGADGCFPVPEGPGLGVDYDWEFIAAHTTAVHRFGK